MKEDDYSYMIKLLSWNQRFWLIGFCLSKTLGWIFVELSAKEENTARFFFFFWLKWPRHQWRFEIYEKKGIFDRVLTAMIEYMIFESTVC